jgi:ParB family chromosome partitioning protein
VAARINAGDVGRGDVFFIDPREIIVDEKLNGRWTPHDAEVVEDMARSFEAEGQLQPVQVRKVADNRVQLVLGYRRHRAAVLHKQRHPDSPMKLKCVVVTVNDEEAFRRNIVENKQRAETTPIDDAFNQRRLREEFGWTDARIAEFYNLTPPYVGLLKKLLMLPTAAQLHVHKRELSVQAAAALADLPAEEQKQALASQQPGESLSRSVVKQVREKKIARGGKQSRSLAEVRSFLEGLTGPAERPQVKDLCGLLLEYIQGRLADDTMAQRLSALFPERKQEEQGAA